MFEPLFKIIALCKMAFGIIIIFKAIDLFNHEYVSDGLITGIDVMISESPEMVTFLFLIMVGTKVMR